MCPSVALKEVSWFPGCFGSLAVPLWRFPQRLGCLRGLPRSRPVGEVGSLTSASFGPTASSRRPLGRGATNVASASACGIPVWGRLAFGPNCPHGPVEGSGGVTPDPARPRPVKKKHRVRSTGKGPRIFLSVAAGQVIFKPGWPPNRHYPSETAKFRRERGMRPPGGGPRKRAAHGRKRGRAVPFHPVVEPSLNCGLKPANLSVRRKEISMFGLRPNPPAWSPHGSDGWSRLVAANATVLSSSGGRGFFRRTDPGSRVRGPWFLVPPPGSPAAPPYHRSLVPPQILGFSP